MSCPHFAYAILCMRGQRWLRSKPCNLHQCMESLIMPRVSDPVTCCAFGRVLRLVCSRTWVFRCAYLMSLMARSTLFEDAEELSLNLGSWSPSQRIIRELSACLLVKYSTMSFLEWPSVRCKVQPSYLHKRDSSGFFINKKVCAQDRSMLSVLVLTLF